MENQIIFTKLEELGFTFVESNNGNFFQKEVPTLAELENLTNVLAEIGVPYRVIEVGYNLR